MPTIKTITLKDGSKRYRFTADIGRSPEGKRQQRTYTFERRKDAKAEMDRVCHTVRTQEFVDRSKMTVAELLDRYLEEAAFEAEANTKVSYANALKPVRERLGHRLAQSVDRTDIAQLRDWMLTSGRRRGGKPGTGLGARSVRLTLGRAAAAWELAIRDRKLSYNPVRYVEPPKQVKRERDTWSAAEVRQFLATAGQDRLHAAWRLTLYGLRRAEVCGLRWEDMSLDAGTLTVTVTRPVVDGKVIVKPPKSERGERTLPLDGPLVAALKALRKRQREEKLAAGPAYQAGLGTLRWYSQAPDGSLAPVAAGDDYVVTDELGLPVHPEWYSDEFHRLREDAGLRRITLHDNRGTASSLMAAAGVPDHIRAAWCGHTVAVNVTAYTHARPEDLAQAQAALTKIQNVT